MHIYTFINNIIDTHLHVYDVLIYLHIFLRQHKQDSERGLRQLHMRRSSRINSTAENCHSPARYSLQYNY